MKLAKATDPSRQRNGCVRNSCTWTFCATTGVGSIPIPELNPRFNPLEVKAIKARTKGEEHQGEDQNGFFGIKGRPNQEAPAVCNVGELEINVNQWMRLPKGVGGG
jgi:hypothetical protein